MLDLNCAQVAIAVGYSVGLQFGGILTLAMKVARATRFILLEPCTSRLSKLSVTIPKAL